jgi:hypothetical protein
MSPSQTPVKISYLALTIHKFVNKGWNEGGSHNMLSRDGLERLNIGQCDAKDSADSPPDFFWLTRHWRPKSTLDLTIS